MKPENKGEIIIYKAEDGKTAINVRLEKETVWLNQYQLADLFTTDRTSILRHIRNIYKTGELAAELTCAKIAQVQKEGGRRISRNILYYNLDLIISVGYRVNSKRGTQFRIWATRVLREHLVKGFTVNERRLKDLHQAVHLITEIAERRDLSGDEAKALLRVVEDYTFALNLLDDYDHQKVVIADTTERKVHAVTYDEAVRTIGHLQKQFNASELFGREKDESLRGSLNNVFQTFEGKELYPSLEEKAANLLYFLVKNHSFVDGNKRIAAALFLWFLEKNRILYRGDGTKRIAENALVAMTLLIAESKPTDKEILVRVVTNLLTKRNK
ncbi:MAG: virulence protein RhuM/Fic/DOC family protein [Bacteroidota bacterium]|jgi:prophage maintenance system killer protein